MDEIIKIQDRFYILATSSRAGERMQVLKQGDTFAVFDHHGDIQAFGLGEQGLYHQGTRYLSCLELRLAELRPLLLSAAVKGDNELFTVDLTNPDLALLDKVSLLRGTVHILCSRFLWQGSCHQRLLVRNYGLDPVDLALTLHFDADFADIFEVRGTQRQRRGTRADPELTGDSAVLAYTGLDGQVRRTRLLFHPQPYKLSGFAADFLLKLPPHDVQMVRLTVSCESQATTDPPDSYEDAWSATQSAARKWREQQSQVQTSSPQLNAWLNRSAADLHMMVTQTPYGPYPYAGVPWFNAPFGRDGIITAFELLWLEPAVARGVLSYLAATQATQCNTAQEAQPGKILHETRQGEMAALHEVPFGCYYGSVDATPLFVMLAGAYYQRTADLPFIETLWPHIEAALHWLKTYGDPDGDGFVEYARQTETGLSNQGWKDSYNAVFHADGALAQGPIALCEVQGYAYAAQKAGAELAAALGHRSRAEELDKAAEGLRERFEQSFWCDELSTYALALDGQKRPCQVRTSNPGHCLWCGIASLPRARRTAQTLLANDSFCGWGIRTVSERERQYNPMSYHNGSVWPHDNAVIAAGLGRYGFPDLALKVFWAFLEASAKFELNRLPELFCGFPRREGEGPTLYPVACAPQAWAAGAVFLLLQACMGLRIDARHQPGQVVFRGSVLPESLDWVRVSNLRVGSGHVDLLLQRHAHDVGITVLRRTGEVEIVVLK